ncbi:MAG: BatA and WFA domain-containing protein [Bacteroidota bacterium]
MSFLSPLLLFAMVALGLPLVIHLLNLKKPKQLSFSTLAFFKELQQTTIRRIVIKRYLLLILRLLAVACLAFVLARPFLPAGKGATSQAPTLHAFLIDNSTSMSRIGTEGPLLDVAKNLAETISATSGEDDRFILQTTHGEEERLSTRSSSQFIERLEGITPQLTGSSMDNRLLSILETMENAPFQNKQIYVISDGQTFALPAAGSESLVSYSYIHVGNPPVQNTRISRVETSTELLGLNIPVQLQVTVTNPGELEATNQFITLEFNDEPSGQYTFSLEPGGQQVFEFEIVPGKLGSNTGKLEVEGDEFLGDNAFYLVVQVPEKRKVLWVEPESNAQNEWAYTEALLQVANSSDSQIEIIQTDLSRINEHMPDADAIVLSSLNDIPDFAAQQIQSAVQNGKGLVFLPSPNGDIRSYNALFERINAGQFIGVEGDYGSFTPISSANQLLENHPVITGLFEPKADESISFEEPDIYYQFLFAPFSGGAGGYAMMTTDQDRPLFYEKKVGEGRVIISAIGIGPGWSNLAVTSIYVPFFYRALLYSTSSNQGGLQSQQLGDQFVWLGAMDAQTVELEYADEWIKPTTVQRSSGLEISYASEQWTPGWVTIRDERSETVVAVNLPDEESVFDEIYDAQALQDVAGETEMTFIRFENDSNETLEQKIRSVGFGTEIWSWFMLAGFLFLVAESLVSIFYKAETVT